MRLAWATPLILGTLLFTACLSNYTPLSEADISDDGIRARIDQRLAEHEEIDLRYVTINVHARIVTVSGLVTHRDEKRLIRTIVSETKGVREAIVNLLVPD